MAYTTADAVRTAYPDLPTTIADETLDDLIAEFEDIAERYRGVAYETRTTTDTILTPRMMASVPLTWPQIQSVTEVTVDDVALPTDGYLVDPVGRAVIVYVGPNVTVEVTYTHGFTTIPKALVRACREYVRTCALADQSGVPRDVIGQYFEGSYTRYSTPDWDAGRPTGYLEIDRLLNSLDDYRPSFA